MDLFLIANICEDPHFLSAIKLIKDILILAAHALPAVLVIISTIDIGKAVITADSSALFQKFNIALKRLALAALIFFTPALVNAVSSLMEDGIANVTHEYSTCISNTDNIEYYEKLEEQRLLEEKNKLKEKKETLSSKLKENTKAALKEAEETLSKNKQIYSESGSVSVPTNTSIPSNVLNAKSKEKLNFLFPGGIPTSPDGMKPYLVSISVPMTKKDGTKFNGNLTVHKTLAKDIQEVFQTAQNSGFKIYEAGAYSFRKMNNGSGKNLSHHSYGVAIDINVKENYSRKGSAVYAGSFWDPTRSEFSIPANGVLVQAFKAKGWTWGGSWPGNYQDYMHFSFTGN